MYQAEGEGEEAAVSSIPFGGFPLLIFLTDSSSPSSISPWETTHRLHFLRNHHKQPPHLISGGGVVVLLTQNRLTKHDNTVKTVSTAITAKNGPTEPELCHARPLDDDKEVG